MNSIYLLFVLAAPSSLQETPSPGPQDIPLRRAQEVAQAFADKAGFKVKVASLPSQFVVGEPSSKNGYPSVDERRWYLGGSETQFTVGARSGRLTAFRRGNRMDASRTVDELGPHATSRATLTQHAERVARQLGVFKPVRIRLGGIWDDAGRPQSRRPSYVVFMGMRRQVQMSFHPKDGDLLVYIDHADAPRISPHQALKPAHSDVSGKAAVLAVSKLRQALNLASIQDEDSFATLWKFPQARGEKSWHIDHPNCIAEVDSTNGKVLSMRHISEERAFKKGDRPFVSSASQAERHLRGIVGQVGVPPSAKANVRITNELVSRIGWVGQIEGTFTWASGICTIVCDLRRGELLSIVFFKPGRPAREGSPLSSG